MSQIFRILFQTRDINIFVLRGVFFSRYAQLKSWFSDEKKSAVKSETHFSREAIEINVAMYERKIPSMAEVGALQIYSYCKTTLKTLMGMWL